MLNSISLIRNDFYFRSCALTVERWIDIYDPVVFKCLSRAKSKRKNTDPLCIGTLDRVTMVRQICRNLDSTILQCYDKWGSPFLCLESICNPCSRSNMIMLRYSSMHSKANAMCPSELVFSRHSTSLFLIQRTSTNLFIIKEAGVKKMAGHEQRRQNDGQRQRHREDLGQKLV